MSIRDIGEIVAQSILDFFASQQVQKTLQKLWDCGMKPKAYEKKEGIFAGKNVVVTGTLASMTRKEAGEQIEKRGGILQSAVGKNTHLLVAGEKAGSKLAKAQSLGIEILDEEAFLALLS